MESKVGTKPKVSVIIPVYNDSEYLCAALESVKRQTMKEIEVICVDDASEDNSRDIIKEYQEQDPRFKAIFHETNLSASEGRKMGWQLLPGNILCFLMEMMNCILMLVKPHMMQSKSTVQTWFILTQRL